MKNEMSKSRFYDHRGILLAYGVDISLPMPKDEVLDLKQFAIDVELKPLPMPDWYPLPKIVDTDNILQTLKSSNI